MKISRYAQCAIRISSRESVHLNITLQVSVLVITFGSISCEYVINFEFLLKSFGLFQFNARVIIIKAIGLMKVKLLDCPVLIACL